MWHSIFRVLELFAVLSIIEFILFFGSAYILGKLGVEPFKTFVEEGLIFKRKGK